MALLSQPTSTRCPRPGILSAPPAPGVRVLIAPSRASSSPRIATVPSSPSALLQASTALSGSVGAPLEQHILSSSATLSHIERGDRELVLGVLEDCGHEIERVAEHQRQNLLALSAKLAKAAEKLRAAPCRSSSSRLDSRDQREDGLDGSVEKRADALRRPPMSRTVDASLRAGVRSNEDHGSVSPNVSESEDDSDLRAADSKAPLLFACCCGPPAGGGPPQAVAASSKQLARAEVEEDESQVDEELGPLREIRTLTQALEDDVEEQQVTVIAPENWLQECLLPVITSPVFKATVGTLVALNLLLLAFSADYLMKSQLSDPKPWDCKELLKSIERVFLSCFMIELALRLLAEQRQFFIGPNKRWNYFESLVLCLALLEELAGTEDFTTAIRVARILRMFRAVRVIRLFRFLLQLRLMLFSVLSCLASLVWAILLLAIVICMFAIYFETVGVYHLVDLGDDIRAETKDSLQQNWNGVLPAIRSLVYSVSGGEDWGNLAQPFWELNILHGLVYMSFVLFITFGLLNILVGVFVQEANSLSDWDQDVVLTGVLDKAAMVIETLQQVFDDMDRERRGSITVQQLDKGLRTGKTKAWLSYLDIDIGQNTNAFCSLLELDANGRISRDSFVNACRWLSGSAKPLIVAKLGLQANATWELLGHVAQAVGVTRPLEVGHSMHWKLAH